jgi:zinc transport system ATP-binding protein
VDAAGQESLTRTLDLLVRSGLTLLVVTHDVAPLMPILTRVVLLHDGRVTRDEPASRFFAGQGGPASVVLPGDHHHPEHEGDPRSAVPGWLGDPGLGDLRVDDLRLGRRGTGS